MNLNSAATRFGGSPAGEIVHTRGLRVDEFGLGSGELIGATGSEPGNSTDGDVDW